MEDCQKGVRLVSKEVLDLLGIINVPFKVNSNGAFVDGTFAKCIGAVEASNAFYTSYSSLIEISHHCLRESGASLRRLVRRTQLRYGIDLLRQNL